MPFVTNQNVRVYYEVEGNGPPLVLQHGFFGSLEDWRDYGYVSGLKGEYTLILIDARGHGNSGKPHKPNKYTLKDHAGDVVAVLDALDIERCHYLGLSGGGRIGFGLVQYWPDRVRSLMILDFHPYPYTDTEEIMEAIKTLAAWVPEMPEATSAHKARLLKNDPQALVAAGTPPHLVEAETLEKIDVPCLIVAARCSVIFELVKRGSEEIKNATFVNLDGFDHMDMLFRGPEVLPYVVDFLSKVS